MSFRRQIFINFCEIIKKKTDNELLDYYKKASIDFSNWKKR